MDSASDELLACDMMRGCGGLTPQSTPNLKYVIRDATHAARRVTAKPEKADPFLQEIHNKLISSKSSISQILHNSTTLWAPRLAARIKELDDHIGLEVRNVRACKHRHESFAKPAGRFVLYLDAYLAVAEEMVASSSSAVLAPARDFLLFLTTEVLVQSAMLADAADECLYFTRLLDDENTDSAKLNDEVAEYLQRLQCLFIDGQCVSLPGYTSFMLKNLQRSRAVRLDSTAVITLGCPHGVPRSIVDQCLARMRSFTAVAKEVLAAEFPHYDLNRAFCIFNLAASGGLTPHSIENMPDEVSCNFRRLAQAFSVDMFELVAQYNDHLPMASRTKMLSGCSNQDAWKDALHKTQRHSKKSHPAGALVPVLQRYLCYTVSTAKVEQSFSKLKRVLGEQCLGGSATFEARLVKVVLDRTGTSKDTERIHRARALWATHWSSCRRPYTERLDKGIARPHRRHGERQWIRVRRAIVGHAAAGCRAPVDGLTSSVVDDSSLTPSHCDMIDKQRRKGAKRKAIALIEGTLLPEEQADARDDAIAETSKMITRAKTRLAAESKRQARCTRHVSGEVLRGLPVFLESDAGPATANLTAALSKLACSIVHERTMAKIIIVKNLADLGIRTKWCAALAGNYVTTADTLEHGRGALLLYREARHMRRTLWLSPQFRERHAKVVSILQALAFGEEAVSNGSQWTLQGGDQPRTKGAVVLMRKGEDQSTVCPKGNTYYDVEGFFKLISKVLALYKLRVA